MYQPAIPLTGYGGWKLLQATYDRQFEGFTKSSTVANDRSYFLEKFSKPVELEDFLSDKRLLRISLTAFDLGGEEWKGGFIRKVMEEAADPASTFLQRLNNPDYTNFSKAFKLFGTKLALTSDESEALADQFESAAFREAVGEVNQSMRLSLNYENRIESIAGTSSSEQSKLYRLLGNVPMRTVMETALGLPKDFTKLDIDRQAEILKEQLQSKIGITDVSQLAEPEKIDKVIQRFHAMESINNGPSATTPGYAALTLLGGSGFGAQASENLFLSLIR
ncbi:DUF1217 domain-containing protein [Henriciella mobilis]|uniref:DUF1217 domain-containing protein n=1 Tax=Henriciella mobilis TaxID=2305467 RepID=A0A399RBH6_9PROT|nr:DUF1217 domain-containing protein [Henriciella mobilis]RIJ18370.1 DUF1217 domain-containing protein [Henriciella mobilis]RIJ24827.1 DUF1217 domain-containing protein [Henriciella mobilis]RIJ26879.1 DUF1217 domain-containing protein [Henriciella mobilis]